MIAVSYHSLGHVFCVQRPPPHSLQSPRQPGSHALPRVGPASACPGSASGQACSTCAGMATNPVSSGLPFLTPRRLGPGVWLWLPTPQLLVPVPSRCWAPSTCSGPFLAAPRQAAWVTAGKTDQGDPRLPPHRQLPPFLRLLALCLWGLLKLSSACTFCRR